MGFYFWAGFISFIFVSVFLPAHILAISSAIKNKQRCIFFFFFFGRYSFCSAFIFYWRRNIFTLTAAHYFSAAISCFGPLLIRRILFYFRLFYFRAIFLLFLLLLLRPGK